jgi:hypothetical protein
MTPAVGLASRPSSHDAMTSALLIVSQRALLTLNSVQITKTKRLLPPKESDCDNRYPLQWSLDGSLIETRGSSFGPFGLAASDI